MKLIVCLICVLALCQLTFSQPSITVSTDKTVSLLFPFPILHIDRGTKDVLVQEVKESDHLLLLKAGCRNFHPTSLSVLTGDGSLYSFLVSYDSLPGTLVYKIPMQLKASIETYAQGIIDNRAFIRGIKDRSWGLQVRVTGIYIRDNILFFQLSLSNDSPIDYDIDFTRFYIRDKKKTARTASQENEIIPVYIAGNNKAVKAHGSSAQVFAMEKFTIPNAKFLAIEIAEKNGGRNLLLKINNRKIIQAAELPDLK